MKKYIVSILVCLLSFTTYAQNTTGKINSAYLKFLPSNANPSDLKPSDIPSEQVLRQMGLSETEIAEAMDFKFQRGKYTVNESDTTSNFQNSIARFYQELGDTTTADTLTFPKAKIYGQDIFRNNELSFFQKALDANAPDNYEVGPGDEISIAVWGNSDYSDLLKVDERGYIEPTGFGRIYVKGLTFEKMKSLIRKKLGMNSSNMDVTLTYSRVIIVNIVGEVYHPGSYSIPAINTAFNALVAANGPTQIGSVRNIYIKRNGKIVDSLDVYEFMFNPIKTNDIYLQDGDYILVTAASDLVQVKGAVNRPYTYEVKKSDNLSDIIKYAGGYTTSAFKDIITLKRYDYNSFKVHDVHINDLKNTSMQSGDEVIVNSIQSKISNLVTLKGSVGIQGDYEYKKGEKLLSLLERAKCINDRIYPNNVYVIRLNEDRSKTHISIDLSIIIKNPSHKDNITLQEFDIVTVLSVDDFDDYYQVSVKGSVRHEGDYDFGNGLTLKDVLTLSGGLKQEAEGSRIEVSRIMEVDENTNKLNPRRSVVKSVNIGVDLSVSQQAQEFILQPYDQIFVRKNPDFEEPINVVILGEVKYPGTYSVLSKDERISSLINRSGGLTEYSYLDGTQLYRKFSVKIEEEEIETISGEFRKIIMSDPDLFDIYKDQLVENKIDYSIVEYEYDMVYLDLEKALESKDSKHNLVLNDGDSIIIPITMDVVHISGNLMNLEGNSISAPFFNSKRANFYVNHFAGGFSKENNKRQTVVVYPNGIVKKSINFGLFSLSPKVKKGSTIKVALKVDKQKKKNQNPIDWNQVIERAMLKTTAVLTVILMIDRLQP